MRGRGDACDTEQRRMVRHGLPNPPSPAASTGLLGSSRARARPIIRTASRSRAWARTRASLRQSRASKADLPDGFSIKDSFAGLDLVPPPGSGPSSMLTSCSGASLPMIQGGGTAGLDQDRKRLRPAALGGCVVGRWIAEPPGACFPALLDVARRRLLWRRTRRRLRRRLHRQLHLARQASSASPTPPPRRTATAYAQAPSRKSLPSRGRAPDRRLRPRRRP